MDWLFNDEVSWRPPAGVFGTNCGPDAIEELGTKVPYKAV
jgi:hypothetical protein